MDIERTYRNRNIRKIIKILIAVISGKETEWKEACGFVSDKEWHNGMPPQLRLDDAYEWRVKK